VWLDDSAMIDKVEIAAGWWQVRDINTLGAAFVEAYQASIIASLEASNADPPATPPPSFLS
jgi:hypothetical protein